MDLLVVLGIGVLAALVVFLLPDRGVEQAMALSDPPPQPPVIPEPVPVDRCADAPELEGFERVVVDGEVRYTHADGTQVVVTPTDRTAWLPAVMHLPFGPRTWSCEPGSQPVSEAHADLSAILPTLPFEVGFGDLGVAAFVSASNPQAALSSERMTLTSWRLAFGMFTLSYDRMVWSELGAVVRGARDQIGAWQSELRVPVRSLAAVVRSEDDALAAVAMVALRRLTGGKEVAQQLSQTGWDAAGPKLRLAMAYVRDEPELWLSLTSDANLTRTQQGTCAWRWWGFLPQSLRGHGLDSLTTRAPWVMPTVWSRLCEVPDADTLAWVSRRVVGGLSKRRPPSWWQGDRDAAGALAMVHALGVGPGSEWLRIWMAVVPELHLRNPDVWTVLAEVGERADLPGMVAVRDDGKLPHNQRGLIADAVAQVQARVGDGTPGGLSLAVSEGGELTLASDVGGAVSVTDSMEG